MKLPNLLKSEHIEISCSSCGCPLVNILVVKNGNTASRDIQTIDCPWCGDHSFSRSVRGGIFVGNSDYCDIEQADEDNNTMTISVVKGKKTWRRPN